MPVHSQKFYEFCSPASSGGKRPLWTALLVLVALLPLAVSPSLLALQVLVELLVWGV
jgi:MYXO-CTERM domain-containing protein